MPEDDRKVSAPTDQMAVEAVSVELVSCAGSPCSAGKIQGNLPNPGFRASPASPIRPLLDVLVGEFPAFGNREISGNEHGLGDRTFELGSGSSMGVMSNPFGVPR